MGGDVTTPIPGDELAGPAGDAVGDAFSFGGMTQPTRSSPSATDVHERARGAATCSILFPVHASRV